MSLRIGQHVVVPLGGVDQDAIVVEDRGLLAPGGTQLVRVHVLDSPVDYELPAEILRLDPERAEAAREMIQREAARLYAAWLERQDDSSDA